MEIKINTIIPCGPHHQWFEIFGYTSKSQPGLDIIGLGPKGRAIKEKLTFLSKRRKVKFPLLRFVLCVEGDNLEKADMDYLELPLLLAFWSLAGLLPIKRLDNCFASGRVGLEGEIEYLRLGDKIWNSLDETLQRREKLAIYLGPVPECHLKAIRAIPSHDLLNETVGQFSYMESSLARSTI